MIAPMLAKSSYDLDLTDIWEDKYYVAEPKIDGERMLIIRADNYCEAYNRTGKDKSLWVPAICDALTGKPWLDGTMLDGEIVHPQGFSSTQSIMGSKWQRARQLQDEKGSLHYIVFDVIRHQGRDMTTLPLWHRRRILEDIVKQVNSPYIHLIEQQADNKEQYYNTIVANGGEGVVLKQADGYYVPGSRAGWIKVKKEITHDVVVTGYEYGKGHYNQDEIAALTIGLYDAEGKLQDVGKVGTGFDDSMIRMMSRNPDALIGRVIEIGANDRTASGKFRHPVFFRMRDDKDARQCTI